MLYSKLKEKKVYIILIILISILIGVIYSLKNSSKEYISSTTIMLMKVENAETKENYELSDKMVSTIKEIIKSESVAEEAIAIADLKINPLVVSSTINVKRNSNSDTFKIELKTDDMTNSIKLNSSITNVFSKTIKNIYSDMDVYIIDSSHIEKINYSKTLIVSIVIAVVSGIVISAIYLVICTKFTKRIKIKVKNIEKEFELKKLIEIPIANQNANLNNNELISYESEKAEVSKAFKQLRLNIQFINVNNKKKNIILLTSPLNKVGKSYISANLAISYAETGKKVVLIDADMISGRQYSIFNVPNNLGFSNFLSSLDSNGVEIKKLTNNFIKETSIKNLNLITSGTVPPNPTELLSSDRLNELIKDLSVFFDVVIIDGSSVLESMDALILSRIATSTILIADPKNTYKEEFVKAKRDIQNVGGKIIGIIINKVKTKKVNDKNNNLFGRIKKILINEVLKIKENLRKQKLLVESIEEIKIEVKKDAVENAESNSKVQSQNSKNNVKKYKGKDIVKNYKLQNKQEMTEIVSEDDTTISNNSNDVDDKKVKTENNKLEEKSMVYSGNPKTSDIISSENIVSQKIDENNSKENEKIDNNISNTNHNFSEFVKRMLDDIGNTKETITQKMENFKNTAIDSFKKIEVKRINSEKINEETHLNQNSEDDELKVKNEEINSKDNGFINEKIKSDSKSNETKEKKLNQILPFNKLNRDYKASKKENNVEEILKSPLESEDSVLVVVDAQKGYSRALGKSCFSEILINGVDRVDNLEKDYYSPIIKNSKMLAIESLYGIAKEYSKYIDPLIYSILSHYDETIWVEKKSTSNKAEIYALVMSKIILPKQNEDKASYQNRCKTEKIIELRKNGIEIVYNTESIWKTNKISLIDKINVLKYKKIYESKNDEEIIRNINNTKFYESIIKKAENTLNSKKEIKKDTTVISNIKEENKTTNLNNMKCIKTDDRQEKNKKRKERRKKLKKEKQEKKIELIKQREEEKEKQKEEARIEEELLEDNLYPKTKNNKSI